MIVWALLVSAWAVILTVYVIIDRIQTANAIERLSAALRALVLEVLNDDNEDHRGPATPRW